MGVSDTYAAHCLDEACFMWGGYVEQEIRQAAKGAKTDTQARSKVTLALRRILDQPLSERPKYKEQAAPEKASPTPKGVYRDPATMFGKKG